MKTKAAAFTGAGVVGGTGLALLGFGPTEAVTFGAGVTTTLFKLFPSHEPAQQTKEPTQQPKASSALRHGRPHPRRRPLARGLRSFTVRRVRRTGR
ncbi:hypothetical protein ACQF36_29785 [Streptomyces sp. Marseille-Q5077]|uniref:hypothetical protein n=1 Tax=Streptomyces sp. Marseille-Q5077 TaxID=3418995 RepID=UPI003D05632C